MKLGKKYTMENNIKNKRGKNKYEKICKSYIGFNKCNVDCAVACGV